MQRWGAVRARFNEAVSDSSERCGELWGEIAEADSGSKRRATFWCNCEHDAVAVVVVVVAAAATVAVSASTKLLPVSILDRCTSPTDLVAAILVTA